MDRITRTHQDYHAKTARTLHPRIAAAVAFRSKLEEKAAEMAASGFSDSDILGEMDRIRANPETAI